MTLKMNFSDIKMRKKKTGALPGSSLVMLLFLSAIILLAGPIFKRIDSWLQDNWLTMRLNLNSGKISSNPLTSFFFPQPAASDDIVLVLIDDQSILGIPGLFQGNRRVFAQALRNLNNCKPRAIGLDVFFPAPSTDAPEQDKELAMAVAESGKTVLRAYRRDNRRMTPPFPELARSGIPAPIFFNSHRDESIRSVSMAFTSETGKIYPSFQAELLRIFLQLPVDALTYDASGMKLKASEKTWSFPLFSGEYMLLNYDWPLRNFTTVSFLELYNGNVPAETFANKLVIIGYGNSMTEEKFYTPTEGTTHSPFLNAMVMRTLLNDSALKPSPDYLGQVVGVAVLAFFLLVIFHYFSPPAFLFVSMMAIVISLLSSLVSLTIFNYCFDVAPIIFAIVSGLILVVAKKYYIELSEKMRIKSAFQHYVTASVVNEILKNPEKLNLHGEERVLTIFFSDIEGFTSLSEGMSPLDVVSLLNEYLSEMTEIIFKFDGLLDKYEGDAIMAVFGAPIDQKDHAIRACRCAIENQKALKRLREKWKREGRPEIKARIGINTGIVVVGNMGSKMRFDYTVIGDNVNLAARLESANKLVQTEILVSEETATLAESAVIARCLGKLKVAGKTRHVNIYEVLADKKDTDKNTIALAIASKTAYEAAHFQLQQRNFQESANILTAYLNNNPTDKPAQALLDKVKGFMLVPPPPGWENIITQENK